MHEAEYHGSSDAAYNAALERAHAIRGSVIWSWAPGRRDQATEWGYWSDPDDVPLLRVGETCCYTYDIPPQEGSDVMEVVCQAQNKQRPHDHSRNRMEEEQ